LFMDYFQNKEDVAIIFISKWYFSYS
jgi:hypothetical protein